MAEIRLPSGHVAIVEDADLPLVERHHWCVVIQQGRVRSVRANIALPNGKRGSIYLHRVLLGVSHGVEIDHVNHDPLDNRRANLRACTRSQNNANRRHWSGRPKGVYPRKKNGWYAAIRVNGSLKRLGCFAVQEDAARAYDTAAREAFGEFAYLNFAEAS